mmetsp:Transcript_16255/g.46710  ORF Transcript_16255/g.46710 Transcript_16255/m.46710 type:complete len:89 (+) Transcript_16255:67-333(+)
MYTETFISSISSSTNPSSLAHFVFIFSQSTNFLNDSTAIAALVCVAIRVIARTGMPPLDQTRTALLEVIDIRNSEESHGPIELHSENL